MTKEELEERKQLEEKVLQNIRRMQNASVRSHPGIYIREIGQYFDFLSKNLSFPSLGADLPYDMLALFESTWYSLENLLADHDEKALSKVQTIVSSSGVLDLFAMLAVLTPNGGLLRYRTNSFLRTVAYSIPTAFLKSPSRKNRNELINSDKVLEVKTALFRIASIVRSIETDSADEGEFEIGQDFRTRFDPDLINKDRVLALISLFKMEMNAAPQNGDTALLLEKIDIIEREVRKKSGTKWGKVLALLLVIYGFASDVKSLNPEIYQKATEIVSTIISIVTQGGQVDRVSAINGPSERLMLEPFIDPEDESSGSK